ncbi:MAG: glycosyltransferase [Oligoflexales bacterium]|nr:glycosyltransferase [Oligoflexales bacterium]
MKILFINTNDSLGGAAVAVTRLRQSLGRNFGSQTHLLVKNRASNDPLVYCTTSSRTAWLTERLVDKISSKVGLLYQYFPFSPEFILKKASELAPDAINLHNIHGGYFTTSLIPKLSRIAPIVWTLHDMYSFTANAAHTFGDISWTKMQSGPRDKHIYPKVGINLGSFLMRQKKKHYAASDITIVPTSRWITELAKEAPVFEGKEIINIPNGIDTTVFAPQIKAECRKKLEVDEKARVIMFSADNLSNNPWKGGKLLVEILNLIDEAAVRKNMAEKIVLLVLGLGNLDGIDNLKNMEIRHVSRYFGPENAKALAQHYAAADLFIYPTRADTFPLVLEEAISCGIPAIAFDVGGCDSLVRNDVSGLLIKPFDIKAFASETLALLFSDERLRRLSENGRRFICENYDDRSIAGRYHDLFMKRKRS